MRCTKCGTELPDEANFCLECGTNLQIAYSDSERPPVLIKEPLIPQPERKHVTALFSDLAGYTAMSEKLDPEQINEIIGRIFAGVRQVITKYEGFIERVMGDGVLVFFGVPRSHEDDPIRAIRAATEIHDFVESMGPQGQEKLEAPLRMHSGINTGLVVTADVDLEKGTHGVAGDAVNVARRLSDLANPGEILVGHETYICAKGVITFEDLGFRNVKGKTEAVHIFKVSSAKTNPRAIRFNRQVSSRLVDRDKELKQLEVQVMRAINGQGSVVNIIGEPGIGKSRLVAELKDLEIMKRATLLEGSAISIGRNLSFHPIINLLRHWARIPEGDSETAAFDKLEKAIGAVHPQEAYEIVPFVATLMGMKLTGKHAERVRGIEGGALEKLIFKSVRDLVIKGAELRPIVIVMEDLHWADDSSLGLLESLHRIVDKRRVVVINVFRPGYFESDDGKITVTVRRIPASNVDIQIHPLDDNDGETLIDNMLAIERLPHKIRHRIVERSGGNPLFIEEVVRSLIDEGVVVRTEGGFEVTQKIDKVTISPTLSGVLAARIDRLDEQTRELVKIASVIGRSFFDRVIKDVADSIDDLDHRLAYLEDAQLIRSRIRMGELEYLFKHALVQEAAYESTLLKQRKQIHLRVAEAIERILVNKRNEFYGVLAYHYGRANALEKTEECLINAGEEAQRTSASNEALHYYQEALGIYRTMRGDSADPEKVAMLEENIALALFNRGRYAEAVEHFDKALNHYWGELPTNTLSTAFRFLSSFMTFLLALYFPSCWFKRQPTGRDAEVVDLFYKRAEALSVINPKQFFIESFFFYDTIVRFDLTRFKMGIGILVGASGLFTFTGLSFRIGKKILDFAKVRLPTDDTKQRSIYDLMHTMHHFLKGEWNEIAEYNEELVSSNLRIGETFYASQHCYWHGLPKIYRGDFDGGHVTVTRLSQVADAYENDIYHLLKCILNTHLLIESRHMKEALCEVNRGVDLVRRHGWAQNALTIYALKALILLFMKEPKEAGKWLDEAHRITFEVKAAPMQLSCFYRTRFQYYLCRLEDSLRNGNKKESSEHIKNASKSGRLLIKTCQKAALYRTDSYRLMGVYHWLITDRKSAFKWWNKALREGEILGALPQIARTYAEMAVRAWSVKGESSKLDVKEAEEHLEKAITMFRGLGLQRDLEDLNSVICLTGPGASEM